VEIHAYCAYTGVPNKEINTQKKNQISQTHARKYVT